MLLLEDAGCGRSGVFLKRFAKMVERLLQAAISFDQILTDISSAASNENFEIPASKA